MMRHPRLVGALLMTVATSAVLSFALSPAFAEGYTPYLALGVFYAFLTALAFRRARETRQMDLLRPKSGDITIGVVTAGILYVAAMGATLLFAGRGGAGEGWIMRVYAFVGNPLSDTYVWLGVAAGVVALLEEIAWRGLLFPLLREELGTVRGALVTTVLYGLAHAPSAILLADPAAGPNPLLLLAAFGCGFVWMYLTVRTGRIGPAMFSHAVFTWAIVEFPVWRPF
jgi:uncharacterized protein